MFLRKNYRKMFEQIPNCNIHVQFLRWVITFTNIKITKSTIKHDDLKKPKTLTLPHNIKLKILNKNSNWNSNIINIEVLNIGEKLIQTVSNNSENHVSDQVNCEISHHSLFTLVHSQLLIILRSTYTIIKNWKCRTELLGTI